MRSKQQQKYRSTLIALASVLFLLMVATSCFPGQVQQPKGWSGGAISNDTLFIGSMDGQMIAVDLNGHVKLWTTPLETGKSTTIYGDPTVGKDLVYAGAYNGKIYALNTSSGLLKPTFLDETNPQPIIGGPLVALGKVYIGSSDKKLYALNPETLQVDWKFATGNKIWSTPALDDETILVTSLDKKIYALDARSGSKRWEFSTGGAISATPVVDKHVVYFGSFDRHVYALDARSGSLKWKSKVKADRWFWTKSIVYRDVVYAPSLDGKVYILNAQTGDEVAAPVTLGSPVSAAPVLVGNSIILAAENGKVYALDTTNYQKRELNNMGAKVFASLAASNDSIYVHVNDDSLRAVDVRTGTAQWSITLKK